MSDGVEVYTVQIDFERHDEDGIDPSELETQHPTVEECTRRILQSPGTDEQDKWRKLDLRVFETKSFKPQHPIYFIERSKARDILNCPASTNQLEKELRLACGNYLVVRSDIATAGNAHHNLPRSETLSATDAVDWIRQHLGDYPDDELCFIVHPFIPAIVSAWSYYRPESQIVFVDTLWGLADGLQVCAHDTFEIDPIKGETIAEHLRFKGQILLPNSEGSWEYNRILPKLGRRKSAKQSDLNVIARWTKEIVEQAGCPKQVMWFCSIPDGSGLPSTIPWFHENADDAPEPSRVRGQNLKQCPVKCPDDINKLRQRDLRGQILSYEPGPDYIRDESFMQSVADLAIEKDAAVLLLGSYRAHTYSQLVRRGVKIFAAESRKYRRVRGHQEFNKLVRDNIPDKIESAGETYSLAQIPSDELEDALLDKIIEEAGEFVAALETDAKLEELADLYELLRAIAAKNDISFDAVGIAADEKRRLRGGFDKGLVLVETSRPKNASVSKSSSRSTVSAPSHRRVAKNPKAVPVSNLLRSKSVKLDISTPDHSASVLLSLSGGGLTVELEELRENPSVQQLEFNFDSSK